MNDVHCTRAGAEGWRALNSGGSAPRKLISGRAGASHHFSQQSPNVWLCASGSKHTGAPHQENALQGSALKGPSTVPGRCSLCLGRGRFLAVVVVVVVGRLQRRR